MRGAVRMIDDDRRFRLIAEAHAWPVVARESFDRVVVALARDEHEILSNDTEALSQSLVERLRAVGRGISLETIRSVRDVAWFDDAFGSPSRKVPLHSHFARVAKVYIRPFGGGWELNTDDDAPVVARRFRWLSLMLPCDLLVAAHSAQSGRAAQSAAISIASPLLRTVLAKGVAETHLHMGGGFAYPLLWASLMRQLGEKLPRVEERGARYDLFGDVGRSQRLLLAAAIARLVMARFLWRWTTSLESRSFAAQLGEDIFRMSERLWDPGEVARTIRASLAALLGVDRGEAPAKLRFVYTRLIDRTPRPRSLRALRSDDPITALFPSGLEHSLGEVHFTTAALRYIGVEGADRVHDPNFASLFWQYVRVRVRLFRYLTLDPGTAGLDWFSQTYARIGDLRGRIDRLQAEASFALQGEETRLDAIELRTTPEDSRPKNLRIIRDVAEQAWRAALAGGRRREVGLTFHFVKESRKRAKGGRAEGSRPYHADPGALAAFPARYGAWVRDAERRVLAVAAVLRAYPEALLLVRSVDVAGPELSMPTWPTLIALRKLREASQSAAFRLGDSRPEWGVPPLCITYHAGEDFRRLIEGVRRIDEVCTHALRPGDRIGHGLALFTPPADWSARTHRAFQPVDERIDDLLWELQQYRRGELVPPTAGRAPFVEGEVQRLAEIMYGHPVPSVGELLDAREYKHKSGYLEAHGYPAMTSPSAIWPPALDAYLRDRAIFRRGRLSMEVRTDEAEVAVVEAAQKKLRGRCSERDITIETNPSSNQLIADFDCIDHHPVFANPAGQAWDGPACSINSDDPLTFSTRLADEYAYVYFALLRGHCSTSEALARMEELRETGLRSRFTCPASKDPRALEALQAPGRPWLLQV